MYYNKEEQGEKNCINAFFAPQIQFHCAKSVNQNVYVWCWPYKFSIWNANKYEAIGKNEHKMNIMAYVFGVHHE